MRDLLNESQRKSDDIRIREDELHDFILKKKNSLLYIEPKKKSSIVEW